MGLFLPTDGGLIVDCWISTVPNCPVRNFVEERIRPARSDSLLEVCLRARIQNTVLSAGRLGLQVIRLWKRFTLVYNSLDEMDSRELLPSAEKVLFVFDTQSLESELKKSNSTLEKLLYYKWNGEFEYLRTETPVESPILAELPSFQVTREPESNRLSVTFPSGQRATTSHSSEKINAIRNRGDYFDPAPSTSELEFIEAADLVNRIKDSCVIIITSSGSLLTNRRQIEFEFRTSPSQRIHIMSPKEVSEFAGIHMRSRNEFHYHLSHEQRGTFRVDLSLWCWCLSRIFIQHFTVDELLSSMLDRVDSLHLSIDYLGEQYYSGTGNNTDIRVRYHFNNGISLLSGIGDVLALHTREKLGVDLRDRVTTIRTGDNRLLKKLRENNRDAWMHVQKNHHFIELIHIFRNDIIHQSGVLTRGPGSSLKEVERTVEWESHAIELRNLSEKDRDRFRKYYNGIDDSVMEYNPMTKWGIITTKQNKPEINQTTQIDTYQFLKQATRTMYEFVDEYLRLLGYENSLAELPDDGVIGKDTVQMIAEHDLFPLLTERDNILPEGW